MERADQPPSDAGDPWIRQAARWLGWLVDRLPDATAMYRDDPALLDPERAQDAKLAQQTFYSFPQPERILRKIAGGMVAQAQYVENPEDQIATAVSMLPGLYARYVTEELHRGDYGGLVALRSKPEKKETVRCTTCRDTFSNVSVRIVSIGLGRQVLMNHDSETGLLDIVPISDAPAEAVLSRMLSAQEQHSLFRHPGSSYIQPTVDLFTLYAKKAPETAQLKNAFKPLAFRSFLGPDD